MKLLDGKKTYAACAGLVIISILKFVLPDIVTPEIFKTAVVALVGFGGVSLRSALNKTRKTIDEIDETK